LDKKTGMSKGNGFVAFYRQEDAEKCLKDFEEASLFIQANSMMNEKVEIDGKREKSKKSLLEPIMPESVPGETNRFQVDGRFITVTPSVSKQIAMKLTQSSNLNRRLNDKRHLYLMREGVIFPNTEAASQLTAEELETRMAQFATRKRLLATNPNLFISRTRLSVRGMHPNLTDAQLKSAARIAVNGFWDDVEKGLREPLEEEVLEEEKQLGFKVPSRTRKIVVKQAKIIRDANRLDENKKPKSKGYGFIEFESHADALACLRYMNNNISAFAKAMGEDEHKRNSKNKKPVVEFAVENNLVLKRRKDRQNQQKKRSSDDAEPSEKKKRTDSEKETPRKKPRVSEKTKKEAAVASTVTVTTKTTKKSPKLHSEKAEPKLTPTNSLRQKKGISRVSKKSATPTGEKPSKRQATRAKKALEEEKFQSLVSSYKKKLLDNVDIKPTTSKWYA
jgi:nucleolar protein 4